MPRSPWGRRWRPRRAGPVQVPAGAVETGAILSLIDRRRLSVEDRRDRTARQHGPRAPRRAARRRRHLPGAGGEPRSRTAALAVPCGVPQGVAVPVPRAGPHRASSARADSAEFADGAADAGRRPCPTCPSPSRPTRPSPRRRRPQPAGLRRHAQSGRRCDLRHRVPLRGTRRRQPGHLRHPHRAGRAPARPDRAAGDPRRPWTSGPGRGCASPG